MALPKSSMIGKGLLALVQGKKEGPLPLYSETKENPELQPCGVTFKATHLSHSPAEVSMGWSTWLFPVAGQEGTVPCTNTSWGSVTGGNPSCGIDWLKKGCLGRGSDSCTKSGSQLNLQTAQLVSLGPLSALPFAFLQREVVL